MTTKTLFKYVNSGSRTTNGNGRDLTPEANDCVSIVFQVIITVVNAAATTLSFFIDQRVPGSSDYTRTQFRDMGKTTAVGGTPVYTAGTWAMQASMVSTNADTATVLLAGGLAVTEIIGIPRMTWTFSAANAFTFSIDCMLVF